MKAITEILPPLGGTLRWRALASEDRAAIEALGAACQAEDGGGNLLPTGRYLPGPDTPHASIGAFAGDGELVAASAARLASAPPQPLAELVGQVLPAWRGHGIGRTLMEWGVDNAQALLSQRAPGQAGAIQIATEALTEAAERLYARHGFSQSFAEDVLRYDLARPAPEAPLPDGIALAGWAPELAGQFFATYDAAFRTRPGFPGWSAEQWIEWATDDEDFRPDMTLLARAGEQPAGFVLGAEGWLVQVGVRPEWRGRGLAAALVAELLRRAHAAGWPQVLLDVNVNNPGAARVYTRLGFAAHGRRARYTRAA